MRSILKLTFNKTNNFTRNLANLLPNKNNRICVLNNKISTYSTLSGKNHNLVRFDERAVNTNMIFKIEKNNNEYKVSMADHYEYPSHYNLSKGTQPLFYNHIDNIFINAKNKKDFIKLDNYVINTRNIGYIVCDKDTCQMGVKGSCFSIMAHKNRDPTLYSAMRELYEDIPMADDKKVYMQSSMEWFLFYFLIFLAIIVLFDDD